MRCSSPGCSCNTCEGCGESHDRCKCEALAKARALMVKLKESPNPDYMEVIKLLEDLGV